MAQNKTTWTNQSVIDFINTWVDEKKRIDALKLVDVFTEVSGFEPKMYGPSIIGFGEYRYKYESGREGEAPLAGFSPRKDALVLYIADGFEGRDELMKKLGKHNTGRVCVYVKKLDDVDMEVMKTLIKRSMEHVKVKYPG